MTAHRRSYWKTVVLATLASVILLVLSGALAAQAVVAGQAWNTMVWGAWVVGILVVVPPLAVCLLVAIGGMLSLRRDTLEERGRPYGLPDSARST
jgi:hypothetical protein